MKRLLVRVFYLVTTMLSATVHVSHATVHHATLDGLDHFHPVIREFRDLIEGDAEIYMGFHQMFDEIPNTQQYLMDPSGLHPQIRNYEHMLSHLNSILTMAPEFPANGSSYATIPIKSMFQWPMCTAAGFRMFTNTKVNAQLKRILTVWSEYVASPASRYVLTKDAGGWFSPEAMKEIPEFAETFECDPTQEFFGYASFDDYFTRRFKPNVRPVASPLDGRVIASGCESVPYALRHNVQERNTFWIKDEPYSLQHLLYDDPLAPQFVGGTVFQSFLSTIHYHRWHSPVSGKIVKVVQVQGTYYAMSPALSFTAGNDPNRQNRVGYHSQAFLTNIATRCLIFIEADNKDIGLMAFAAIGMMEVSSTEATVKAGQRVKKGDEIGMFHYGGSSYVMVFRPETKIDFSDQVMQGLKDGKTVIQVGSHVGTVRS
ncbi:hypothetical protein D9756_009637 [Leucocoprinus leucothites]|uniref:L-tryptophan decarboxylase PsiD-like domain-containing protein n=1 Tax=Leucocoprinus leucothites TaxID=201217 RepID=A0A8H5FTK6_9AGAR|nr:hypothetical protein D9756_009637 [Leucoagaricus leucothites]